MSTTCPICHGAIPGGMQRESHTALCAEVVRETPRNWPVSAARCEMVRVVPGEEGQGHEPPPCGKPRRRRTCCDECFEKLIADGDFTREEAEREYPIDWPAFWRSLPPREQWEAAKAMPKVAGRWVPVGTIGGHPRRKRFAFNGGEAAAVFFLDTWVCVTDMAQECAGLEDGMAKADAALREAGWILAEDGE